MMLHTNPDSRKMAETGLSWRKNTNQAQPENAYAGGGCVFTAQNTSLGVNDVDSGVVYLVSIDNLNTVEFLISNEMNINFKLNFLVYNL